jgi:Gas vesicle synthesis protein GvpL/GvpF
MTSARERVRLTAPRRAAAKPAATYVYVYAAVGGQPSPRVLARIPPMPDGQPPRILALSKGVALVVSDVPADSYRPERLEPRLGDSDWVAAAGAAHHTAAEVLSRSLGVLPFRMFSIFSSDARLIATLTPARTRIEKALAAVAGRDEWVLRVGAPDAARISGDAAAGEPLGTQAVSGTGFLRQKAAAKRARLERVARVKSETATLFSSLEALADQAAHRPIPAGTTLLLDAAFLIEKRKAAAFRRALSRTAQTLLDAGCPVSLTGPWPPYSFASIEKAG